MKNINLRIADQNIINITNEIYDVIKNNKKIQDRANILSKKFRVEETQISNCPVGCVKTDGYYYYIPFAASKRNSPTPCVIVKM